MFTQRPLSALVALVASLAAAPANAETELATPATPSLAAAASPVAPASPPVARGAKGDIENITIETGRAVDGVFALVGRDARQQLLVEGAGASGARDLTRQVSYRTSPPGIVAVSAAGGVTPLANGRATITAQAAGGLEASIDVVVSRLGDEPPINFTNQIVPVFTKLSCNSGGCHGKASGQNGFRLSLLGFEPAEDYEHLVKEARGRRVFPAAPEQSLLLKKPLGDSPHGGGTRLDRDSHAYRTLYRWIAQGMPYGRADDPTITRVEVLPKRRVMSKLGEQQLLVVAHYSDGSTEDVTGNSQFEPNSADMAEVSSGGLVTMRELTGDVAVMARYQGQVDVFRGAEPLGAPVEGLPAERNFIDTLVFKKLCELGMPPSGPSDDATFLRRVSIDICGRTPTGGEVERFLADRDPEKRDRLIDHLLNSRDYADYFATKWSSVLRNKRRTEAHARGTYVFHAWIRENLYANTSYDELVRRILTASGEIGQNPPVTWYREVKDIHDQTEDMAQLFLGLRIKCAQCHHHPYERWSQQDYSGLAAFFSRVGRKNGLQPNEERIYHKRGAAGMLNPKTQEMASPAGLGSPAVTLAPDEDPRQALVDWMTDKSNPYFAPALVNRYWKHFFGRGLVDPEDDMRVTNPATNPELLAALAEHFTASGYDLKDLVRTICRSQTYQLSAEPNAHNMNDRQNFSRYYPKRLAAEVLLDAVDRATGAQSEFNGMPPGTRAVQLPDTGFNSYFLTVFGRPESSSACECERSGEANLAQSLHLLNSAEVQSKLSNPGGRVSELAQDASLSREEKIRRLYLGAMSRAPQLEELDVAMAHLGKAVERLAAEKAVVGPSSGPAPVAPELNRAEIVRTEQGAMEDILWALINTKEFLFNH